MDLWRNLAATAIAAATAATPSPPAQTPGSNITVTTCHAQLGKPPLRIAYVNDAPATATEVDFSLSSTVGTIVAVTDRGEFASGKPINKVFPLPEDLSPLGLSSARCVVTKVVYANGAVWTNPSPPPPP